MIYGRHIHMEERHIYILNGVYLVGCTQWSVFGRVYLVESAQWNLLSGIYSMESTQ